MGVPTCSCLDAGVGGCVHVGHTHVYMRVSLASSRFSNLSIFSPTIFKSRRHPFLLHYCPHPSFCPRGSAGLANAWSSGNICGRTLSKQQGETHQHLGLQRNKISFIKSGPPSDFLVLTGPTIPLTQLLTLDTAAASLLSQLLPVNKLLKCL